MKGRLIYVVGASGSGKDTLLKNARKYIASRNLPILFAHRYITRPVELVGENHIALNELEFDFRLSKRFFVMHWESHGLKYGLGVEINFWMEKGVSVVMNGSREYLPKALQLYPEMLVVQVVTSRENLKARLLERGRENHDEIEKRLGRAMAYTIDHPDVIRIDSSGAEENTLRQFTELIHSLKAEA
jgi:ribose 1,5-bisphosphokinase